ncbi:DegT/DnrJ/EryC1/StrS family aminotransferase [bacterium]|nr:MAG: DegT/DnrJ/EryC1/StrS family aminotransferase [bacterium]
MINVTKTCLPPLDEYVKYLEKIWASGWVTNNGELVRELETRLAEYLGVPYIQFVSNGTIALQLALKALEVEGEVITTPFSYVATVNSILWEHCTPIFVDIEDRTFCMDAEKIEAAITERTRAILPVHVYGYPCDVFKIQGLVEKYNLKVIYDGAHAFGCELNGVSLLNYGDLSTLSFHATKLFHTIEGGAIIAHTPEMADKLWKLKSFGHRSDEYFLPGINGKNSEFHAAMGLCLLPRVDDLIQQRRQIFGWYDHYLSGLELQFPQSATGLKYNYSYYPVIFKDEATLLGAMNELKQNQIIPRRYFYPPLNSLPFVRGADCPVAEDISARVLCLPLYVGLEEAQVQTIFQIMKTAC